MKLHPRPESSPTSIRSGFSLVEMIGVLAIIAILAVIIVPKVFSTIASSRVTSTVASVNSVKTALTDFSGKYGAIPLTASANSRIDDLLVTAGLMDGRFLVKVGTQPVNPPLAGAVWARNAAGVWAATGGVSQATQSRIVCQTSSATAPATALGRNFNLSGDGTTFIPTGSNVVAAVIVGVTPTEALELSQRIDGDGLSENDSTTADSKGRVVYTTGATRTVYIYIAHQ